MLARASLPLTALTIGAIILTSTPSDACCPAPPRGQPVMNADQSVILVWDKESKTEHFIRRASFDSNADDFGFLVPTPAQPELSESGDPAFSLLQKVTEPEHVKEKAPSGGGGCCAGAVYGYGAKSAAEPPPQTVTVLQEKVVAGFQASVLEASSATALTQWLKEHGYELSPAVEEWAKPYVDQKWKITALRVAKNDNDAGAPSGHKQMVAPALRMSFRTERPLFPYREPDPGLNANDLAARQRLLRIYFVSDARFNAEFEPRIVPYRIVYHGWVAWAGKLKPEVRSTVLDALGLPATTAPREWWLTEYEDPWRFEKAATDLFFEESNDQSDVRRPPIVEYVANDPANERREGLAYAGFFALPALALRLRRSRR